MRFGTNKTPVEMIKEGAFGGAYLRDILVLMADCIESIGKNLRS